MTSINDYFNEKFGILVLFVLLAGFIGDVVIHLMTYIKFAKGLVPYYKSLEYGENKAAKYFSSFVLSGIFGGIACVIALVFGQLFLYAHDYLTEKL